MREITEPQQRLPLLYFHFSGQEYYLYALEGQRIRCCAEQCFDTDYNLMDAPDGFNIIVEDKKLYVLCAVCGKLRDVLPFQKFSWINESKVMLQC